MLSIKLNSYSACPRLNSGYKKTLHKIKNKLFISLLLNPKQPICNGKSVDGQDRNVLSINVCTIFTINEEFLVLCV